MKQQFWFVPAAVLALGSTSLAATIVSTTGSFAAFPSNFAASTPAFIDRYTASSASGIEFWNNPSDDTGTGGSHMMNIGDLLADTGGFAGTPSVLGSDFVTQAFLGAGGSDPSSFFFASNATPYNISLLYANSSLNGGGTTFGYYRGNTFTSIYSPANTNSRTGTQPFVEPVPNGTDYGFYVQVCYSPGMCEIYTTGSGNSGPVTGAAGYNHFALFQMASGSYVLGFEDTNGKWGENMGDFNDIVVELVDPRTVPEPSAWITTALGLAVLGTIRKLRAS